MIKKQYIFIIAVLLLLLSACVNQKKTNTTFSIIHNTFAGTHKSNSTQLVGKVINTQNQQPIAGAQVSFSSASNPLENKKVSTNQKGTFTVNVVEGIYQIVAVCEGYLDSSPQNISFTPGEKRNFVIELKAKQ